MRAEDINIQNLLKFLPGEGKLILNDQRMVLFSQDSFASLQKLLVHHFGFDYTSALFSQFGFQCGSDDYVSIAEKGDWDSDIDRIASGPVIHMWEGIVHVQPTKIEFDRSIGQFHMTGIWKNSYEAENYIKNYGLSKTPVCSTLTGYASGWASKFFNSKLIAIETECTAKGDPHCSFEIKPIEDWGPEAEPWIKSLNATSSSISSFLEREIEERTRELKKLNEDLAREKEKAENAARAKSNFLASMSHEIRTPMNGVLGMAELLSHTPLNDEQTEFVESLLTSSELLLSIINDILDFSKLEAGKLDLYSSDIEIRNTISECMDLFQYKIREKRQELTQFIDLDVPGFICIDDKRLKQVLINLLGNAIKFTDREGNIHLDLVKEILEDGEYLKFSIIDSGIGIPKDKQKKLFSPFTQVDASTTKNFGGTGLGLAISLKIVDQMGGSIWLESEEGKGSTFSFRIPLIKSDLKNPEYLLDNPKLLFGKKVFSLDDNPINLKVFQNVLTYWKMDVESFLKQSDFFARLAEVKPDIVLLDYNMPEQDGLEVARKVREIYGRDVFLALCTSYDLDGLGIDFDKSIFDFVLIKPIKQKNLYEKLLQLYITEKTSIPESKSIYSEVTLKERNFLLVEDNPINQKLAKKMFHKLGYHIDIAENGQEGFDKVLKNSYDMIFMDIHMPVMDGHKAIQLIHSEIKNPPPIVVMSADVFQKEDNVFRSYEVTDYIIKPIKLSDIQNLLKKYGME